MSALTGTPQLVRLVLRRDRVWLPVWVLSLVGITYVSANAVVGTYDTPAEILSYARNIGSSPATIAFDGPPVALETIQGILVYETSLTVLLGVSLMAIFTVVRHTRAEEEVGRTELLASTVVGRHAATAAAMFVAVAASVLVGLGVTVSVLPHSFGTNAALLYGASVAALGTVFAAIASVAAQLLGHARTARGVSLSGLGVAFALRALGDVNDNALVWLSPMGWSQQVRATEANRWWPLLLSVVFSAGLVVLAGALTVRRDIGSGVLPDRPGPGSAGRSLSTPLGLAWRLQRGSVLAWGVALLLFGMLFGSVSKEVQNMVADNPTLAQYFERTGGNITDAYFSTALLLMGIASAGFAVGSALRLHTEEGAGRLEPVLAGAVTRTRAMLTPLLITVGGSALLVLAGGLGLGIADALVTGDTSSVLRLTGLALVHLPAVLVLAAVGVLLTGWWPGGALLAWVGMAVCFVIGWLGGLLDLPSWVTTLSPFEHVPSVPVDPVTVGPLLWLSVLAAGLTALGVIGFRRRDIG
ncbi:ABC transporter permease [Nocardioides mesophilus]|uniref:ABC transporter permease n=1 Tax=Nocardioides mesophilus TaxID=433659 RepID=A0A7G9RDV1_9ACTN|nr:hypothetical protein [Nocardioides mesophilus]QNN53776.1 hypothetical protein H9L09_05030 [Nocardioides mesophilus]